MTSLKTVLITGCSSGIGRACVPYLAARDWRVIATARRLETIQDLRRDNVDVLELDVADETSRVNAINTALERYGRMDALVNNAGYSQAGPLAEVTLDEMRTQYETNVFGAFHLAQLVLPAMRAQKAGRIINVSSIVTRIVFPFGGLYCSSKWAMEAMSDALRMELKPFGVSVILVEPGAVVTRIGANSTRFLARFKQDPSSLYHGYLSHAGAGIRESFGAGELGSPPETVARVIYRAMTERRCRPRYQATWDAWLAWPLLPLVPDWVKDFVIAGVFGLNKKETRFLT